ALLQPQLRRRPSPGGRHAGAGLTPSGRARAGPAAGHQAATCNETESCGARRGWARPVWQWGSPRGRSDRSGEPEPVPAEGASCGFSCDRVLFGPARGRSERSGDRDRLLQHCSSRTRAGPGPVLTGLACPSRSCRGSQLRL
uniref:Uncharacterized protein n=1 Tax=Gallus gallus TaxID=9031 RepID=A0A8V0XCX1_CHICK